MGDSGLERPTGSNFEPEVSEKRKQPRPEAVERAETEDAVPEKDE